MYFATKFHVDGFRFDLMALIDQETMRIVESQLRKINKNILLYGEPWVGGDSSLAQDKRSDKKAKPKDINVSLFNDEFRNAIKRR